MFVSAARSRRSTGGTARRGKVKEKHSEGETLQGRHKEKEEREKGKKGMHSFGTSLPHELLPHLLPLIITIFAHCEPQERGKAPFAPASYFLGVLDVLERNQSSSVGLNLFSPQCGGWTDVFCDSWKSVVMKEGCGVR